MRRREFVTAMVSAAVMPKMLFGQQANPAPPLPAPVPWTVGLNPSTPMPVTQVAETVAQSELLFFTPAQMATLSRLSDVLLPPLNGKPGAVAAETPAFLDFLIGGSPDVRKLMYQSGLDWLDAEAKSQFSKPFAELEPAQADRILQPWMRTWMSDHPPMEAHADFINIVHADIRTATVSSKAWSETPSGKSQEATPVGLYWAPIDPDLYAEGPVNVRSMTRAGKRAQ